ncbi:MAG TPA: OmpA family protein, partial [Polyangiaceae bacterium]|nr:OmpA family protein [Polyangiaceae bacterium]
NFSSEPGFWYWPHLVLEERLGDFNGGGLRLGLDVGYRGHTGKNPTFGLGTNGQPELMKGLFEYSNLATMGFGASVRVLDPLDLVGETYATYETGGNSDSKEKFSAEALGGIKLFIEKNSFLMMGAGSGYQRGFEAADFRGVVGFVFEPSIGDRDGDGIPDDLDKCPDDPEDFDGFQDKDGCPDPDNDNDGIPDKKDRCPNIPEDRDGDQDADGCPEGNDGDRDGDGILDSHDKCPDQPEDKDGFEDSDGCPDPDNDKDGIPDKQDACPNDPEDKDGFQDEDGCPDPDNDNDGIPDKQDKCPGTDADVKANKDTKETWNGFEDDDGCPDKGSVIIQGNDIMILQKIKFRTNSAEILPESNTILDAVGTTLTHHPEFTLIEIQGHADERAPDEYNLKLTQDRVDSVMSAMVSRGVDRTRLRSKGFGEYCPANPGHNETAWEENRRVEFKVVKTKDGPTGVELGCANASAHGVRSLPVPP